MDEKTKTSSSSSVFLNEYHNKRNWIIVVAVIVLIVMQLLPVMTLQFENNYHINNHQFVVVVDFNNSTTTPTTNGHKQKQLQQSSQSFGDVPLITKGIDDQRQYKKKNFSMARAGDDEWWTYTLKDATTLLNDIDIDQMNSTTMTCGYWKCFYTSKSHPNYGYLIGQRSNNNQRHPDEFTLSSQQQGYDLAMELQHQIGSRFRHFVTSPPVGMNCSNGLANALNVGVETYIANNKPRIKKSLYRETHPKKYKRDKLIVGLVKKAPQPNLLISLSRIRKSSPNYSISQEVQTFFFKNQSLSMKNDEIYSNFIQDWNATLKALMYQPALYQDFQFLLDPSGRIYQIDLDRVWGNTRNKLQHTTIEEIETLIINPIKEYMMTSF